MKLSVLLVATAIAAPAAVTHTEAGMGSIHLRLHAADTVYVSDFGECTAASQICKTGVCIYYNPEYAECKPSELPSGALCAQNDTTSVWEHRHCSQGEECVAKGTDSWCTKTEVESKSHHHTRNHHRHTRDQVSLEVRWVDVWQDCTQFYVFCNDKEHNTCIYHSRYYAQCMPNTLPSGSMCGQNDGDINWKFDACPPGEQCSSQGRTSYCTKSDKAQESDKSDEDEDSDFEGPEVLEGDGK